MSSAGGASSAVPRAGFRAEIQALRALSVLLVVGFHLWPDRLTGGYVGVDVFFVISGYLITSHLLREASATSTIRLSQFYARRIRRLLPAAFVVLIVTLVGVLVFVPRSLWQLFVTEIGASAVYVQNWVLAFNAVDYFAEDNLASPVQHYWSLSVEEQFYLIWPLLVLVAVVATRKSAGVVRTRVLAAVFGVILVASLTYSIIATAESQQFAYFATPAHGWEFAAGGLLALVPQAWLANRGAAARSTLSWLGFAAVGGSALAFDGETAFPGYIALLPIIGALVVIAVGTPQLAWSPTRLISSRPVQFVGDISYSLYLWHWPPIAILAIVVGGELSMPAKLGILLFAFVAAWLTKIAVEDPLRSSAWLRPRRWTFGLAAVLSGLMVLAVAVPYTDINREKLEGQAFVEEIAGSGGIVADPCFGASASQTPAECVDSHKVTPAIGGVFADTDSQTEWIDEMSAQDPAYNLDCAMIANTEIEQCELGPKNPTATIVLVGDSHVNHLLRPFVEIAIDNNYRVLEFMKGSCRPAPQLYISNITRENEADCQQWKEEIFDYVADLDADLIVTSGATQGYNYRDPKIDTGAVAVAFEDVWSAWLDDGQTVLAVSDVPRPVGVQIPQCVLEATTDVDPCAMPRDKVVGPDSILEAASTINNERFASLSLYDYFCDVRTCHFVVGGVITHKDTNHMTSTFASTLRPFIEPEVKRLMAVNR